MAIAHLSHAPQIPLPNRISQRLQPVLPGYGASSDSNTTVGAHHDLPFVSLEDENSAKTLVEKSDREMALKYVFALAESEASASSAERSIWNPQRIPNIAPYSTFGMVGSNFARTLKAEPFATFARNNNIDTSVIRWDPDLGGSFECRVNGKITTFGDHVPGWTQASADLKAAANLLRDRFTYTDEHSAPIGLVASFYDHVPNPEDRRSVIGNLLSTGSFAGLSGSKKPYHRAIIEDQRQAILGVASLRASGQLPTEAPAQTVAAEVEEADQEVARMSATALLARRNELRTDTASPTLGYVITPPERSTVGQTIKAFNNAFEAEGVKDFLRNHNLDVSNLHIRVPEGDLLALDRINRLFRIVARVNDQSGWAQVSTRIRALANTLGEGANELVPYTGHGSISLKKTLNFYGVVLNSGSLPQALTQGAALYQNGFPALNPDTPLTDERSRAVQQQQRAAIQQLEAPATPRPPPTPQPPDAPPATQPWAALAQRQFAGEPTLYTVIARLLSDKIKQISPGLDVDVNHLAIATLDPDNPGQLKQTQLMELALDCLSGGEAPPFTSAHRALDTRPNLLAHTGNPASIPLPLDLAALGTALRTLPDQLNAAVSADSSQYWSKPAFSASNAAGTVFPGSHRDLVSSILRDNLQLSALKQPGLDDEQRKTLDQVLRHPVGSTRPVPEAPETSGATVYNWPGSTPNLLIHRFVSQPDREILLLVEPSGKITPYNTWDDVPNGKHELQTVSGDAFDTQAETLIKQHQGANLVNAPPVTGTEPPTQTKIKLPDWLSKAGEAERFVLHDLSLGLASFIQLNKGKAYNSDIQDIRTFAQEQFDKLPESEKGTHYPAKDLEVVFNVAYGTLGGGGIAHQPMSLTDMLLKNLSGLPNGQIEVYYKTGLKNNGVDIKHRVPSLEKEQFLKKLVEKLDIGKTYPVLLKEKLLDNPAKKAERRELFVQQVPLELQTKALELSAKGEAGFNPTGFRYVQEILKPGTGLKSVDGKEITLRPLAFDDKANGKVDGVEGAYLIEPKDSATGPHILYRPLIADAPLLQFPTRQALLEAIQKKGKLQNDTLAWMPDENTRKLYSGNGFIYSNLVVFGINLGSVPLNKTIPLADDDRLQQTLQQGKLMEHLYETNARNLISLAEHQSTSSELSRWESLKTGGFLLLNALMPALRGPAATLGLLLQAEGIASDLETLRSDDPKNKEGALADLLLNLATVLIHFKARSSTAPSTGASTKAAGGRSILVNDPAITIAPSRNRFVLGGPTDIKPLADDIQVFEDRYNGKQRLNIMGHGEKPLGDEPAHIFGEDGKRYTAEDIDKELSARGINIRDYAEVRLLACYSANGGEHSLAYKLNALTGARVKGFKQEIIIDYNGVDGEDPFKIYEEAAARYRQRYSNLDEADIHLMAEKELNRKLAGRDIEFNVRKDTGTEIEINRGSDEEPELSLTKVDYQPRTFGAPKEPLPPRAKPVEVLMGYSHTVEDAHSVLSTRSLTDCSAIAVLTDLKDGVYQKRTLMHLTGSNLEFGLFDKDTYQVIDELDKSLANGGKVIFVGGIDSQSAVGMGVVLGQEFQGKKPLLALLKKPGVETTIASSLGVDIKPDGTFTLIEGTGKGVFTKPMINDVFDFAD